MVEAADAVLGGGACVSMADEAAVVSGAGAFSAGEIGRGEAGRGDVGGAIAIIGGVMVRTGDVVAMRRSETGSEIRGGDGAVGSTGCAPSAPTTPWSATFLEDSEVVVE